MLRLLYFTGGYTTHDRRFLESLAAAGHDVHFLRWSGAALDDRALPVGVHSLSWRTSNAPPASLAGHGRRLTELRGILRDLAPDAVIAGPLQTCAFLAARAGAEPLVAMSWGSDLLVDAHRNRTLERITRYVVRHAAGALGDCQAVHDAFLQFGFRDARRIATFPWGIDLQHFQPQGPVAPLRQMLGWESKPIFLCTRSFEPVYAIDVLVEAFARAQAIRPDARLVLVGSGSQQSQIERRIDESGLCHAIHLAGRIGYDRIAEYFRAADVYVSSALSDGTSVSLLEAMACGLPAVVTAGYGNLEWVAPGKNGWLVPPGDAEKLAAALVDALADPARLEAMGQANQRQACARADWPRNFRRLLQLLDDLADRSAARPQPLEGFAA